MTTEEGKGQVHPIDQLILDVTKLQQDSEKEATSDDAADKDVQLENLVDTVRYGIIPLLSEFVKLWVTGVKYQQTVNGRQVEAFNGLAAQCVTLEASLTTVNQRLEEFEPEDDSYDTRFTVEHADLLRGFVLASIHNTSKMPPGEEQQAMMLRGNEILKLIQENTLEEVDDDNEEDDDADDDV